MTTKADDDLLALAERCEKATAGEMRLLLILACEASLISQGYDADTNDAMEIVDRFEDLIDAEAFFDAAMTLVPEWPNHGGYRLTRDDDLKRKFIAELWEHPDAEPGDGWHRGRGATMPLALCAASLRAMASRENNGGE